MQITLSYPKVKLSLEDVASLKTIQAKGISCGSIGRTERLKALGLVTDSEAPPCPKELASYNKDRRHAIAVIKREVANGRFDLKKIYEANSYRARQAPKPRKSYALTPAAEALLKNGTVEVKLQKACL